MRKFLEIGGFLAGALLIVFGVAAIVMGVDGRSTVRDNLKQEQIVGSADMSPAGIKEEAMKAGLSPTIDVPTIDVAGKPINTGERARAFAGYMPAHLQAESEVAVDERLGHARARSRAAASSPGTRPRWRGQTPALVPSTRVLSS